MSSSGIGGGGGGRFSDIASTNVEKAPQPRMTPAVDADLVRLGEAVDKLLGKGETPEAYQNAAALLQRNPELANAYLKSLGAGSQKAQVLNDALKGLERDSLAHPQHRTPERDQYREEASVARTHAAARGASAAAKEDSPLLGALARDRSAAAAQRAAAGRGKPRGSIVHGGAATGSPVGLSQPRHLAKSGTRSADNSPNTSPMFPAISLHREKKSESAVPGGAAAAAGGAGGGGGAGGAGGARDAGSNRPAAAAAAAASGPASAGNRPSLQVRVPTNAAAADTGPAITRTAADRPKRGAAHLAPLPAGVAEAAKSRLPSLPPKKT